MSSDKKTSKGNRIPIRFLDSEDNISSPDNRLDEPEDEDRFSDPRDDQMIRDEDENLAGDEIELDEDFDEFSEQQSAPASSNPVEAGGPEVAELVATRAELKRVESEVNELKDRLARRQADFENYRKRVERERNETYHRVVGDIAGKLLPVLDNLRRALDAEETVESSESDEFRHFLSGVDLIYKQLDGVIDALGVKPVPAVGERFDPHVHEAVVTEPTDEYEPDTVVQEIVRGYRMGDKLIRPSLVKVAVRK